MVSETLSRLFFGRDEAELDVTAEGLLQSGFLRTAAYESALSGRKRLIIGRKGSGKSAICMMLDSGSNKERPTCLVTPDDASVDEIRLFDLQGLRPEKAKELMWRYILSVQVAKFLVIHAREQHRKAAPSSVDALRQFLLANGETSEFKIHEKFWRMLQRLKSSLSLEAFGAKVALEIDAPTDGLRKNNQLEVIEKGIALAMNDLDCQGHPMPILLVDRLEELWLNDSDSDAMIIGLLLAAKQIPQRFKGVRCAIFLRSDIYDLLEFGERDKLHGDEMRIDWTRNALAELLRTRATSSLGYDVTLDALWTSIFPSNVHGQSTSTYLIDHTLMRPRDLIQLANRCRDVAEQNGHDSIEQEDIIEALPQYSGWKLQDLVDEYAVNYPFLSRLFSLFEDAGYLALRPSLSARLESVVGQLRARYPEFADNLTVEGLVDILYGIGFLGVKRNGRAVYSYERRGRVDSADNEFLVHPCFRPALRCLRPTNIYDYQVSAHVHNRFLAQSTNIGNIYYGEQAVRPNRDFRALTLAERSATRVLELLAEAQLPSELREEIAANLSLVIDEARRGDVSGEGSALSHAHRAREYLAGLAIHLEDRGFVSDDRIRAFSGALRSEARRLGDELSRLRG